MDNLLKELDNLFKQNQSLPQNIGRIYHQTPLIHMLEEKWDKGVYTQKTAWDLSLSKLLFCPIAYREIQTTARQAFDHWLDTAHPNWEPLEDTSEAEKYLTLPIFGRTCKAVVEGQEIGTITEYISATPNYQATISLLDYASQEVHSETGELIQHVKCALEEKPEELLPFLLPQLPQEAITAILAEVEAADHFACIAPPEVQRSLLDGLMFENGFSKKHHSFDSTILSTELNAPTKIIKAWGLTKKHRPVGMEFFIPTEPPLHVDDWIHHYKGAHLAFRVKTEASIDLILNILNNYNIEIPQFMHGSAMNNQQEKIAVLYCETEYGEHPFRIEFCHQQ